jgi:branched-chain amino acid transport system ATP-binding protein
MTAAPANAPLLRVDSIGIRFGGLAAVDGLSLSLRRGQLHGLIGPNGAGKTTCFNLLTGVYTPTAGDVLLEGTRLNGRRPHAITRLGLARTFQNIRLFQQQTVLENVKVARHLRSRQTFLHAALRTRRHRDEERAVTDHCMALLDRFDLANRADVPAGALPYGDQRRLEIARALATGPKVLLLDEPAAGMNPREKVQLQDLIRQVRRDFDIGILLIEHDMNVVMNLCEHITVLDHGVPIAAAAPEAIRTDPKVIEAYLGAPATSVEDVVKQDLASGAQF